MLGRRSRYRPPWGRSVTFQSWLSKGSPMNIAKRLLSVARPYAGRLLLVAVLTSLGALGELVEPWVYRAIINDIAGVFVSKATGLWPEILEELRSGGGEADVETPPAPATPPPSARRTSSERGHRQRTSRRAVVSNLRHRGRGQATTHRRQSSQARAGKRDERRQSQAGAPQPAASFAAAGRAKPPADCPAVLDRPRSPAADRLPRHAHPVVGSAGAAGRHAACQTFHSGG